MHPNLIGLWKKEFLSNAGKVFTLNTYEIEELNRLKKENDDLVHQIGKLTVDINRLKKGSLIPLEIRREMIDKSDRSRSICNQCELLGLARSTLYYTPTTTNDRDLKLMKELDRLYLEDPTRGTRRMTKELKKIGYQGGMTHVRTLLQIMRLKTVCCSTTNHSDRPRKIQISVFAA